MTVPLTPDPRPLDAPRRWTAEDYEREAYANTYKDLDGGDIDMTPVEMNDIAAMLRQAAETERAVARMREALVVAKGYIRYSPPERLSAKLAAIIDDVAALLSPTGGTT